MHTDRKQFGPHGAFSVSGGFHSGCFSACQCTESRDMQTTSWEITYKYNSQGRQDPASIHVICNRKPANGHLGNQWDIKNKRNCMLFSASMKKKLTRQRRQNRLSKESRAASRSFSRKEFSLWEISSVSPFLEPPPALSSLLRVSYLACIRCLTVFHISVKPAQSKWETAGRMLTLRPVFIRTIERGRWW